MLSLCGSHRMQTKTNIASDIQMGKERIVLKHHTDLATLGRHMNGRTADLTLHEYDASRLHRLKSGDGTQYRGLAATRWAEQTDDLTFVNLN